MQLKTISWKQALAKKVFSKTTPNRRLSLQLLHMAEIREDFLRGKIDQKFIALRLEAYFDVIRELLLAHLYKNGWQCTNQFLLPLYAEHHFHQFHAESKAIKLLFYMKQKIHQYEYQKIADYLQKNEEILFETIAILKERLHEE